MVRSPFSSWIGLAALGACAAFAPPPFAWGQVPPGYRIVQVSNSPFFEGRPRINNAGQIVFVGRTDVWNLNTQEIYLYDIATRITRRLTNDNIADMMPDINDDGVIVWGRSLGPIDPDSGYGTSEIVLYRDGQLFRLTDDAVHDDAPRINNLGQVVWSRWTDVEACGAPTNDIWMFDGASVFPVTTDGATDRVSNQSPMINDLGDVVWTRYNDCDAPPGWYWTSDIMLYSGGSITRVNGYLQTQPQGPAINNRRQIVFDYYFDSNPDRLELGVWEDGAITVIGDQAAAPAISDRGDVAFSRWHDETSAWDLWLSWRGELYRLTSDPAVDADADMNRRSETVWTAGLDQADIFYLQRFAPGDLNCDGSINPFDIQPFIIALSDPSAYSAEYSTCDRLLADVTADGSVNQFDIQPFVEILSH